MQRARRQPAPNQHRDGESGGENGGARRRNIARGGRSPPAKRDRDAGLRAEDSEGRSGRRSSRPSSRNTA